MNNLSNTLQPKKQIGSLKLTIGQGDSENDQQYVYPTDFKLNHS